MNKYKIYFQKEFKIETLIISSNNIENEKLPSNVIKIKQLNIFSFKFFNKIKSTDVANLFFELNIILKANIPLYDALEILCKSSKNEKIKEILMLMMNSLKNGYPIYKSLEKYDKELNSVVISFLKIAHENGNINEAINSLSILLKSIESNKKLIRKNFSYPTVLFFSLLISLSLIFNFVIPKFEYIFSQYNTTLPIATIALLGFKNFIVNYFALLIAFFIFGYFYFIIKLKKSKSFKYSVDKFIINKFPVLGGLLFTTYFHRFFLSLKILLNSNYKFQSSIINSSILIKNQYLLDKITFLNKSIQSGEDIYTSFEKIDLFDDLTLRLIATGEKSNSMLMSINEIEKIYKERLEEKIKLFSSLIEPVFIFTIMLLIVWVVLAVLVPMWSIGEVINM